MKRLGTTALYDNNRMLRSYILILHKAGTRKSVKTISPHTLKSHDSLFCKSNRCLTCRMNSPSIFSRLIGADTRIPIFSSQFHAGLVNWVSFAPQVVFVVWLWHWPQLMWYTFLPALKEATRSVWAEKKKRVTQNSNNPHVAHFIYNNFCFVFSWLPVSYRRLILRHCTSSIISKLALFLNLF